jgi:chemotaxis protein MotB
MAADSIIIKKKKIVGHGGHHGGSWKVAYADFVTAMMAFFMVLWIMGLSDDTKTNIQGYFNDPAGFMKNPPHSSIVVPTKGESRSIPQTERQKKGEGKGDYEGSDQDAEKDTSYVKNEIKDKMYKIQDKDHVVVSETSEGILIEFLEDITSVFFETGSAKISPLGKQVIKQVVPIVKDTGRYLVLEGHTDKKPYAGSDYTNWELSTDRASAFRKELAKFGVPVSRFKEVRGYADTKLKFPKEPFAPGNRRVAMLLPWGKKAGKTNSPKIQNNMTRQSIGPKDKKEVNLLVSVPKPAHL